MFLCHSQQKKIPICNEEWWKVSRQRCLKNHLNLFCVLQALPKPFNKCGFLCRLIEPMDVVYECGPHCGCSTNCSNRVTQKGMQYRLEVCTALFIYHMILVLDECQNNMIKPFETFLKNSLII